MMTELQAYCLSLLENNDNDARIFGVVYYAPVSAFSPNSEWFVRADGTIATNNIILDPNQTWLRANQTIYSNRLALKQGRDNQGVTYQTALTGNYTAHSAAVMKELESVVGLPLIVNVQTATGNYIIGTPDEPIRLVYDFDNLGKYNFTWSHISRFPPRGYTNAAVALPPIGGGGGGSTTIESLSALINSIFGTTTYRNDEAAKAGGRNIGELYILSQDNDYSFDLYRTPKRILE